MCWRRIGSRGMRTSAAALTVLALTLIGCGGDSTRLYRVEARYRGLEAHRVAVLVAAPDAALARQPDLAAHLATAVTSAIARQLPAGRVQIVDPGISIGYQQRNPFWPLQPADVLYESLGADRLLIIDLGDYRLRDPDHNYLWLGMSSAHVSVYEAESSDPANPRFAATITAQYPEDTAIGLVQSQPQTIAAGLNQMLARNIARLFHDHEVRR